MKKVSIESHVAEYLSSESSQLPNNTTILELGSWKGESTLALGTSLVNTNKKIIAVDHFKGSKSEQSLFNILQPLGPGETYKKFIENTQPIKNNLTILKKSFSSALSDIPDNSIELIFLDGDHECAYKDITNWWPKLRPLGKFIGHDYLMWPQVRLSVEQFTKENNLDYETPTGNIFTIIKPINLHIIIPTYNATRYINACIKSIYDQITPNINLSVIIVDDHSTDGTWEKIKKFTDSHIHKYHRPKNSGSPLSSFLFGISKISNLQSDDIVAWLDGDDWLLGTEALIKITKPYINPQTDMAYSQHIIWYGNEEISPGVSKPLIDPTLARYGSVCYSHLRTFRTSMLDKIQKKDLIDPKTNKYWQTCGDSALFIPMLEMARNIAFVNQPIYLYNRENILNEDKKGDYNTNSNTVKVREKKPYLNKTNDYNHFRLPPTRRFKADTGRICNLSCKFCYYTHMPSSERMNLTLPEMEKILLAGKSRGNRFCDFSGGEPTIIPDFHKWLIRANQIGLYPCIITHGQNIYDKLDLYWDSGLSDILFSIHGTEDVYNSLTNTKDGFNKLYTALIKCNSNHFKFRTNTVLTRNYTDLVPLAEFLSTNNIQPYISNFINFNPYNEWSYLKEQEFQGRVSEIAPYLKLAIKILTRNNTMVNVRYFPMCLLKGYEKHICNIPQVMHDSYEWDYTVQPKLFKTYIDYAQCLSEQTNIITPKCSKCSITKVCGGLNKVYYKNFGDDELRPYSSKNKKITDPLHFRIKVPYEQICTYVGHNYFWVKEKVERLFRNKCL